MKFHLRIFVDLPSIHLWTYRGGPPGVTRPRSGRGAHGRLKHSTRVAVRHHSVAVTSLHAATNEGSQIYVSWWYKLTVIGSLTRRQRHFVSSHSIRRGRIIRRLLVWLLFWARAPEKNERVACHEMKSMTSEFNILGQATISEVRLTIWRL